MKNKLNILITSTSFIDTPGNHHELIESYNFKLIKERGPLSEKEMIDCIDDIDGIICGDDFITENVIKKGKSSKLKVISKYGIGLDKIDLIEAKKQGIIVCNTPGVNHIAVSEHILALIFTYYKNIHLEYNVTIKGGWNRLIGHEIFGKKIGILGLGRIGKELSVRSKALGLDVLVHDPYLDKDFVTKNDLRSVEKIENLIQDIDILALTLPLDKNTIGLVNSSLISKANKKLVIVNTSRALIINQECLIDLLNKNKIEAYLTDVLEKEPIIKEDPLLKFKNVLITPHIASRTYQSVQRQGLMAVKNLIKNL